MDSSGSLTKTKEKRERQPNWTEAEKQLLISLTRMHHVVLENKGSDTMTIKRKSEAWDEITINMKAAGYQRSKERLKQQLGRIRAADAKKAKDALARELVVSGCSNQTVSTNDSLLRDSLPSQKLISASTPGAPAMVQIENRNDIMPTPLQEEIEIKIEKATSLADMESFHKDQTMKSPRQNFADGSRDLSKEALITLQPFSAVGSDGEILIGGNSNDNGNCNSDGDTLLTIEDHSANQRPCLPMLSSSLSFGKVQRKRLYIKGRIPRSRLERTRQLHMYRVGVERERLKTLHLQQKRDRLLYRKDLQIQNLKLQILHNLANQNRTNHINL